jgi:hypothetical protein
MALVERLLQSCSKSCKSAACFGAIEATERELYWAGILREEFGGTSSASLQLPPNGHDASFDRIEARLQPVAYRRFFV